MFHGSELESGSGSPRERFPVGSQERPRVASSRCPGERRPGSREGPKPVSQSLVDSVPQGAQGFPSPYSPGTWPAAISLSFGDKIRVSLSGHKLIF